jgi:hypothetical protein
MNIIARLKKYFRKVRKEWDEIMFSLVISPGFIFIMFLALCADQKKDK